MIQLLSWCWITLIILVFPSDSQYVSGGFTINRNQYTLRWEVFGHFITFRAIARGTGYVGFGLSPTGTMEGSDLFLSGLYDNNGTVYGIDANGAGVVKDAVSNYLLLFVRQSPFYTEVHFRRTIHTGDCKEDIRIMNKPQYVIWSIGPPNDVLETHGKENRGSVLVNLLNPPMFHSYYSTSENPENAGCIGTDNGAMGKDNMEPPPPEPQVSDAAAKEPDAPEPAEEAAEPDAPAEKIELEEDATLI